MKPFVVCTLLPLFYLYKVYFNIFKEGKVLVLTREFKGLKSWVLDLSLLKEKEMLEKRTFPTISGFPRNVFIFMSVIKLLLEVESVFLL